MSHLPTILLVDEPTRAAEIERLLRDMLGPIAIQRVADFAALDDVLHSGPLSAVVAGCRLAWTEGRSVLRAVRSVQPHCPVVLVAGPIDPLGAAEALRAGAADYVAWSPGHEHRLPAALRAVWARGSQPTPAPQPAARLESLLDRLDKGVFCASVDGRVLECNDAFARLLGLGSPGEASGLDLKALFVRPEEWSEHLTALREVTPLGARVVEWRNGSGELLWVSLTVTLLGGDAAPVVEGLVERLSGRRLRVEALRSIQQKLRAVFDSAQDAILIADNQGRYVDANPAAGALYGLESADLIGRSVREFAPPTSIGEAEALWREFLQSGAQQGEFRLRRFDGEERWLEYRAKAHFVPGLHLSVLRDVTDRKAAETAAQELQARLRAVWENSAVAMRLLDEEGVFIQVNAEFCRMVGKPREELEGRPLSAMYAESAGPEVLRLYRERFAAGAVAPTLDGEIELWNGTRRWFELSNSFIEVGDRPALLTVFRDVTERKRALQALQMSEARFRLVWESATDGMRLTDEHGTIVMVNPALCKMFETSREQVEGQPLSVLHHARYQDHVMKIYRERFTGREVEPSVEACVTLPTGRENWFEVSNCFLEVENEPLLLLSVFRDVDERKRAEDARRESDERLRYTLRAAAVGTWSWDIVSDEVIWSLQRGGDAWAGEGEHCGSFADFRALVHPDDWEQVQAAVDAALAGTQDYDLEFRILAADGAYRWTKSRGQVQLGEDGRPLKMLGISLDITDRKEGEEALRQSERRFRSLIEQARDIITILEADGTIRYESPSIQRVLGYTPEELLGHNAFELIHPDDAEAVKAMFLVGRQTPGAAGMAEIRYRHRDGSWRCFEAVGQNLLDDPAVAGIVVNSRDVTERKRAEEALRISEARFRTLFESSAIGIVLVDRHGRPITANRARQAMLGYSSEELETMVFTDYTHPDDAAADWQRFQELVIGARDQYQMEKRYVRKDGAVVWARLSVSAVHDPDGQFEFGISMVEDITEQKRAEEALRQSEEALRQSQKMEALGRLAGGVAHDFNNMIAVITGYSDMLMHQLSANDTAHNSVREIKRAGERASGLTRQLLAFSRKQVIAPQRLGLNETVHAMEGMLRRLIGEDVVLVIDLAPDLGIVEADPGQIEQVIMNLAINARDAMPEGGFLRISTQNLTVRQHTVTSGGPLPGDYVRLSVQDTGCGMDEDTRTHVFEPFFTTKDLGKGTGLGLSTVYGIVEQTQGYIQVESELGHGATFHVYLPQVISAAPAPVPDAPPTPERGSETILLVEDEVMVRGLVRSILYASGYTVLEAENADAALRLCRDYDAPIHLLLTDVVMPGMSGRMLAEQVTALRPQIRVVLMSGYTNDAVLQHRVAETDMAFIQKPFTPVALRSKVREVLDHAAMQPSSHLKLAAVDDSALIRGLLQALVQNHNEVELVGLGGGVEDALALLRDQPVDVLLLDYQLGELNGAECLRTLAKDARTRNRPLPKILFCTGDEGSEMQAQARALGAAGVLHKTRLAKDLFRAVRAVANGEEWFSE